MGWPSCETYFSGVNIIFFSTMENVEDKARRMCVHCGLVISLHYDYSLPPPTSIRGAERKLGRSNDNSDEKEIDSQPVFGISGYFLPSFPFRSVANLPINSQALASRGAMKMQQFQERLRTPYRDSTSN